MLRVFCGASVALVLAGCASLPQPKTTTAVHRSTTSPVVKQVAKPIEAAPAEKPKTFKERWLSKFFRNRAQ